jgi:cell wall-associated NlpC family hydrolase
VDERRLWAAGLSDETGIMRRVPSILVTLTVALSVLLPAQAAMASFTDVPPSYWDATAISYVAVTHPWMADFGSGTFQPTAYEARRHLARTLVEMYAPNVTPNTNITFTDLPATDPFYPYAVVATQLGWMPKFTSGRWDPTGPIRSEGFDMALVLAVGLKPVADSLANIHMADGTKFAVNMWMPYLQIARAATLHYNHTTESMDLEPGRVITRDEVAYSLYRAKTIPAWNFTNQSRYLNIALPTLDTTHAALITYALAQIGLPYIWGGEWGHGPSPVPYCCGTQPEAGADCSGFVWWVMKQAEQGYLAATYHPSYPGWSLLDRTSTGMALNTTKKIAYADLQPGDLMFFVPGGASKTAANVDHVALYAGNGWVIHSSSYNAGVMIDWVGSGYYHDNFVFGRRLTTSGSSRAASHADTATDLNGGDAV